MIFKILPILQLLITATTGQNQTCSTADVYTASSDSYLFSLINLNFVAPFDGPSSIATATTSPSPISNKVVSEAELKYYIYFAAAMYCPFTLPNLTCCYCGHFNGTVSSHKLINGSTYNTLAMVSIHPSKKEIVVTFRGSVAIMNWIMDFTLLPTSVWNVKIHTGNFLGLMAVYNGVVQDLATQIGTNPTYRVVVTGHSLGGDLASLFVYFMKSLNQFPSSNFVLICYAPFRTGNKGYADYMNSLNIPMVRVVARADIIPHIIPISAFGTTQLLLGTYYIHHGQEVWVNGHTITYCSKTIYEDPSCSNSMGPAYTIVDHAQYFDVDITQCYFVEGWSDINFLTLPGDYQPTSYIPPMPTIMYDILGLLFQGGYQVRNGYSSVPVAFSADLEIKFNTAIREIVTNNPRGLQIVTTEASGESLEKKIYNADTVLCTLPLGVLRHSISFFNGQVVPSTQINFKQICAHNAVQFTPPLPSWKTESIGLDSGI